MPDALNFTENPDANRFLAEHPLGLLIGMLLDQQIQMEIAFHSPYRLCERLGGTLDAAAVAAMDPDDVAAIFAEKPALHRFPGSMGKRTHALCAHVVEHYDGRAEQVWESAADGQELLRRLKELPGFGVAKARIFAGVVGKRLGYDVPGWEEVAADWPSIADVAEFEDVFTLREQKRARKAANKAAQS